VQQSVLQVLKESEVSDENIDSVMHTFEGCDLIQSCLDVGGMLLSSHKQSADVKRNSCYIKPKSIYVGDSSSNKFRDCWVLT